MRSDEWFKNNQVISFVGGIALFFFVVIMLACAAGKDEQRHDPEKMLDLRSRCLATDTSMFTTTCDNFAEKYSRIP
jgi:hypothetical protein